MARIEVTLDGCDGVALVDLILGVLSVALVKAEPDDQAQTGEPDHEVLAEGAFQEGENDHHGCSPSSQSSRSAALRFTIPPQRFAAIRQSLWLVTA